MQTMTWGKSDAKANQGWAMRLPCLMYWTSHYSRVWGSIERCAEPILFDGRKWENSDGVSYPYAVVDDYGFLWRRLVVSA